MGIYVGTVLRGGQDQSYVQMCHQNAGVFKARELKKMILEANKLKTKEGLGPHPGGVSV